MKLLTKSIKAAAEKQFSRESNMEQDVVAKFFNPCGAGSWYLMNKDPKDNSCWGIVKLYAVEIGSFDIDELQNLKLPFGLGIERDLSFKPMKAAELYSKLKKGEHV